MKFGNGNGKKPWLLILTIRTIKREIKQHRLSNNLFFYATTTLTFTADLESVFRSLKSELGLRPVYHRKEKRVNGHLFITLLAYHLVQTIRCQLKAKGIHDSWQSLRDTLDNQQRITVVLKRADGKTIHLRKTTHPEPHQKEIIDALELSAQVLPVQKTLID